MAKSRTADRIVYRAPNNVYTALVLVALIVQMAGFAALYFEHQRVFGTGVFDEAPKASTPTPATR